MAKQDLYAVANNATYPTVDNKPVLLCYEVWYTDDKDQKQMVAAYWDVLTAWKVMEAINASVYGNLGVAEVGVASGMEQVLKPAAPGAITSGWNQPRTDVLNEDGMRSQPNEQKFQAAKREFEDHYNDQIEPESGQWDGDIMGHSLYCNRCGLTQAVKQIFPPNMRHADPTESYRLECGHVVI